MKIKITQIGMCMMFIMTSHFGIAQQKVSVNGQSFKSNLEVVLAQISDETISLVIHEIDKTNPKYETDNCNSCPDGKSLILDVDFKRGFKFPIEEKDSVYLRVSNLQNGLKEHQFNTNELNQYEQSRDRVEESQLKNTAEVIKQKGIEISKKLQEGKISPQEAEEQLTALMQPQMNALDNSTTMKNIDNIDEYQERSVYAIHTYNDETLTETETFSGYLYIKTFNEEQFVAEFVGEAIESCVEKRMASSKAEEEKCKDVASKFLPETKVLREGKGQVKINITLKDFLDNR